MNMATGTEGEARPARDFSGREFAARLWRECAERDGEVKLLNEGLTDESMARLAEGLLQVFFGCDGDGDDKDDKDDDEDDEDDEPPVVTLKHLILSGNEFGGAGLGALAGVLSRLSRCRETLLFLDIDDNAEVTTLAPLAGAGVLEGLKELNASRCSLSGDDGVLPPELCANLPALEHLDLSYNRGGATVTLTAEALCGLPAECQVLLGDSKVQVARPSAEDGEMGLVALSRYGGEFEAEDVTVAEICAFAGVQRVTLVKPARA